MSRPIQNVVDRVVTDITPAQRDAIEGLVGGNLSSEQRVFVLAYYPNQEPTDSDKFAARESLDRLMKKSHEAITKKGILPADIDDAIDEAIRNSDD